MQIIEFLFSAFEGCIGALELVGLVLEAVAWFESRPNRGARRAALREGAPVPRRTAWTWLFQLLTLSLILLALVALCLALLRDPQKKEAISQFSPAGQRQGTAPYGEAGDAPHWQATRAMLTLETDRCLFTISSESVAHGRVKIHTVLQFSRQQQAGANLAVERTEPLKTRFRRLPSSVRRLG